MPTTLVLGASGTVGSAVADLLAAAGHTVRRATSRTAGPGQVSLDLLTGQGLDAALVGADSAFLMAPPGHVNQDVLLGPVIDRAAALGLRRVVLMTAMGADADPQSPMRKAELQLEQSGLDWNVIRPNWFMQNFHTYWLHGIRQFNAIQLPTGSARGSFIDARDIAAVAATLLQRADLAGQALDLTGDEALSHADVAEILSAATGRTIRYDDITPDAMRGNLLAAGLPSAYAEFMLVILHFFSLGYSARITDAVQTVTGTAPRRLAAYAQEYRSAF